MISAADEQPGDYLAVGDEFAFTEIAQTLVRHYFSVYCVDTDTYEFVEYVASGAPQAMRMEQRGTEFFTSVRATLMEMVYPEDRARLDDAWDRQDILNAVARDDCFSISCPAAPSSVASPLPLCGVGPLSSMTLMLSV